MDEPSLPAIELRSLSVVVPAYNEVATVGELLRRARTVDLPVALEVVVVDDGSTDGTAAVLATLRDPVIRVVTHERNRGKGAAVRTGLSHASGDVVLVQDADLEYDPADWPRLVEPILERRAAVVYGSRFAGGHVTMPALQRFGNRLLCAVTGALYATKITDMETCFKVMDRRVLEGMTIDSDGFEFEAEITAKVLRRGFRIAEVPVSYSGRTVLDGKKITWKDGAGALAALAKYRFERL